MKGLAPKLSAEKMEIPRPLGTSKLTFARDEIADKENIPPSPTVSAFGRQAVLPAPLKQRKVQSMLFAQTPAVIDPSRSKDQDPISCTRAIRRQKKSGTMRSISAATSFGHGPSEHFSSPAEMLIEEEESGPPSPDTNVRVEKDKGWLREHGRHVRVPNGQLRNRREQTIGTMSRFAQRF